MRKIPVTYALMLSCVVAYLVAAAIATFAGAPLNLALVRQPDFVFLDGGLIPSVVGEGEIWRLLTSMFLHSGLIHLAVNMVSLYFLGSFVEPTFGRLRFFALYVLSGLSGGIAYLYFGSFEVPAVGASGAIFGLLGGVFGYSLRRGTFSWQNPVIRQLLLLLALNLYIGFSIANVSNTAHLGGLTGGALFGWLVSDTLYSNKPLRAMTPILVVGGLELLVVVAWFLTA